MAKVLGGNLLLAPSIPLISALIPATIAAGALQATAVMARPIPKFAKGKGEYDNYEGYAIWGENKQELMFREDGSVLLSPEKIGNHVTYVGKNDVIHPDANNFFRNVSQEALTFITPSITQNNDNNEIERILRNHAKQMEKNVKKNNVRINQSINISEDVKYLMKGDF